MVCSLTVRLIGTDATEENKVTEEEIKAIVKEGFDVGEVQEVEQDYGIPVVAVATLDDLMAFLRQRPDFAAHEAAVARYRKEYGVAAQR